ncbi:MAG: DUF86 domain-containing protein [Candidatus Woesearchaeota archaeon]
MKRKYDLYVQDILKAIAKIREYTQEYSYEEFINDTKTMDATIRNFEIIGEAINQIPESARTKNPAIPWKHVRAFRNLVVHKYWKIDTEILWDIITNKLDELEKEIKKIL